MNKLIDPNLIIATVDAERADIKARIVELELELARRNYLIETLKKYATLPDASKSSMSTPSHSLAFSQPKALYTKSKTLVQLVKEVAETFGDSEFRVLDIEQELIRREELPAVKYPRGAIAMQLKKLLDAGEITKTYVGIGSEPHYFKMAKIVCDTGVSTKDQQEIDNKTQPLDGYQND